MNYDGFQPALKKIFFLFFLIHCNIVGETPLPLPDDGGIDDLHGIAVRGARQRGVHRAGHRQGHQVENEGTITYSNFFTKKKFFY